MVQRSEYTPALFTFKYNVGMRFDSDVERLCFFFFPAPYLGSLCNIAGNFLIGKNVLEFVDLFIGDDFNIDIFRQEGLNDKRSVVIDEQADLCRAFNAYFDIL